MFCCSVGTKQFCTVCDLPLLVSITSIFNLLQIIRCISRALILLRSLLGLTSFIHDKNQTLSLSIIFSISAEIYDVHDLFFTLLACLTQVLYLYPTNFIFLFWVFSFPKSLFLSIPWVLFLMYHFSSHFLPTKHIVRQKGRMSLTSHVLWWSQDLAVQI